MRVKENTQVSASTKRRILIDSNVKMKLKDGNFYYTQMTDKTIVNKKINKIIKKNQKKTKVKMMR